MFFHVHVGPNHPLVRWMKTRSGQIIASIMFCTAFTLLALFAGRIGARQFVLSQRPGRVGGEVVETHTFGGHEQGTEVNTAVRYRFAVDGRDYHYVGPTGGQWCDVSAAAMDTAARTGRIDVIYHPADPWNNAPASKERWLLAWAAGLILLPGGLAVLTWAWVVRASRFVLPST